MSIKKVIENGYCVGCGACSLNNKDMKIFLDVKDGFLKINNDNNCSTKNSHICPFSDDALNETELAKIRYVDIENHDNRIGFYNAIFTGKNKNVNELNNSSSGGLVTWFAEKLLSEGIVDAVIHVGAIDDKKEDRLFSYRISTTIEELKNVKNKKSRYYPVSYNDVIDKVSSSDKKYLFIGIPCFIKSIRLLQEDNKLKNIVYTFSLLCGHMKSAFFSQSLAWQVGVSPNNIKSIDFRIKNTKSKANDYDVLVENKNALFYKKKNSALLGSWWGHGFFRHKSCDFCDDIAGELADATFGDAWLPKFIDEPSGRNIVILRNEYLNEILKKYKNELDLEYSTVDDFYLSQAGNYRNRRDSIMFKCNNNSWNPKFRRELCDMSSIPTEKIKLYKYRTTLSRKSIEMFEIAKKYNSYNFFEIGMTPYLFKYDLLNKDFKSAIKRILPLKSVRKLIK